LKRILVPSNFDDASARALKLATALSKKNNSRIYILRVVKTHGGADFDKEGEIVQDSAHDIQQYVDKKKEETDRLEKWATPINPDVHQVAYGALRDKIPH